LFSVSKPGRRIEWWDGETGLFFKICWICQRYSTEGTSWLLRNSPVKVKGVSKRTSVEKTAETSLGTF